MALVKKSVGSPAAATSDTRSNAALAREADAQRKHARTLAKQQQASERIASATAQLASGINEAASAAEELKRSSDQIATGAEEASGAAQESLAAFKQVGDALRRQSMGSSTSQDKVEATERLITHVTADINGLLTNVGIAAQRQSAAVNTVSELEKQAANIGDIVKAVARIADQTNLLALNAAIEAARAGKHGKGFAVVADEVRTLAETSEKSAQQIQDLVVQIQKEVKLISEGINTAANTVQQEVENGRTITEQLDQIRVDIAEITSGIQEIAAGAEESSVAAQQAIKGSEEIAAAAEEQSSASEETAKTVAEQTQALAECEQAAQNLSELADELRNSTDIAKSAEEVASAAEELSSAVQEINRSSGQIMEAIEQIRKSAQIQSSATEESSTAVTQIEKGVEVAQQRGNTANEKVKAITDLLAKNKADVESLVNGVLSSGEASRGNLNKIKDLGLVSRRIDKIVDAITTVSIQTNMLAVNGSIEAARAGEFGKGFVVVATDIRNLAHDSAENADRIKDLVKSIQDQISVVGRDLEEIINAAIAEAEKAKSVSTSLVTVESDVQVVSTNMGEILEAANEIAAAIAQVRTGVEQISAAAQEAERASAEASSAAKQQSQGAEELAAAIEEIASLADELQSA